MAVKEDIRGWIDEAKERGATHLLVVCDKWDLNDYPVFVTQGQSVHEEIKKIHRGDGYWTIIIEVYSLAHDIEEQLNETRAWHVD